MPLIYRNIFAIVLLFFVCTTCDKAKKQPNVSHIPMDIHIIRFDREMASLHPNEITQQNKAWSDKYGSFYSDYIQYMLEAGSLQNENQVVDNLNSMVHQQDFQDLAASVEKTFPDLTHYEKGLNQAFRYIQYYFPSYEIPKFYSYFSGFSVQTPLGEDYIGVGLDMFLGAESEFYPAIIKSVPLYISRRFTPENIVPRVIESVIRYDLATEEPFDGTTLDQMVYQGKVLYAMDLLLPNTADSLKIGYTTQQMDWANHYESEIWAWFVSEDLLYSTDYMRIQKFFSEAPFTPDLGTDNESAPKLGSYLGWKIVQKFMDRNSDISLQELMIIDDAQEILSKSGYRGK